MIANRRTVLVSALILLLTFELAAAPRGDGDILEVKLKGVMMWAMTCIPNPKDEPTGQVFFAVEGTPAIKGEVDAIMKECWKGDALDCDQAVKLNNEWVKRLKYYVTPNDVTSKAEKDCRWQNPRTVITGTLSEKGGKKWITPTRIEFVRGEFNYPDKMLAADRPLQPAGKEPLVLKVSDNLSLKCILLPAGKFLQGSPFYQWRYQDEYPFEVMLTKPFYMSEIPITQEMFEAAVSKNPSKNKGAQFPVEFMAWDDVQKFCKVLSEKNGKTVRVPTDAELEYADRVGTSNPCFPEKYKDQISKAGSAAPRPRKGEEDKPLPKGEACAVKTMKPNAWGLYDTLCGGWTLVSDYKRDNIRVNQVDPKGPPTGADNNMRRLHGGFHYDHIRPSMHGAYNDKGSLYEGGTVIFRVVVEADEAKK